MFSIDAPFMNVPNPPNANENPPNLNTQGAPT
jgi:hypothetical protein